MVVLPERALAAHKLVWILHSVFVIDVVSVVTQVAIAAKSA